MGRLSKGDVHNAMGGGPRKAQPGDNLLTWRPSHHDRCSVRDCPAQAWVKTLHEVAKQPDAELYWCAHHYHDHEIELISEGCKIDDHRQTLWASESGPYRGGA